MILNHGIYGIKPDTIELWKWRLDMLRKRMIEEANSEVCLLGTDGSYNYRKGWSYKRTVEFVNAEIANMLSRPSQSPAHGKTRNLAKT